jgi:hypothetical protein
MYRTDRRNDNYDNTSEVLMGAKNVIRRMLDNEDRAIIACKQMHDYRLQLYHFGTSTSQRAAQILSPCQLFSADHILLIVIIVALYELVLKQYACYIYSGLVVGSW